MKILVCVTDNWGSGYYRLIEPYSNLDGDFTINNTGVLDGNKLDDYDGIILQRPCDETLIEIVKEFKEKGKLVVTDVDDDLFKIPVTNMAYSYYNEDDKKRLKTFRTILDLSDYCHVATPQLKYLHPHSTVFYNAINHKKYREKPEFLKQAMTQMFNIKSEKIVMWAGSATHGDSLELIRGVIDELTADKITVFLISNQDWLNEIGFTQSDYLKISGFIPFTVFHTAYGIADVALAPLPDNDFNTKKSELRCLEGAAYGVPTVCSDTAPYRRFYDLTKGNVIVKKERTKEWLKEIYSLLQNPEHYKDISEKAKTAADTIYNLETVNQQRKTWWDNTYATRGLRKVTD